MLTQSFADAIVQAEKVIAEAPHVESEQDLLEGYDYLAGSIRAALQSAWAYDRDFPHFARSATPYTKVGLDNPDTLYFSTRIRPDAEYVVTGTRGTTTDLSFQVLDGDYSPADVPGSSSVFDDRDITIGADGTFELRFHPAAASGNRDSGNRGASTAASDPDHFTIGPGAAMLLVREVFSDWNTERPGTIRIQRADRVGAAPPAPPADLPAKRYSAAGRILLSQLKAFLAFPEWYYLNLPVNTLTEPRPTPGGLSTQFSSVGHYDLADDQAMVVTVPASEAPYQGIQLGSMWYISMDFVNHQTSLTTDQARIDPDGRVRFVIGERDPGVANWLECTGHRRGYVQLRWQRLDRALTPQDGPEVEIVDADELPRRLPYYERARVAPQERAERVATRQAAIADRMLD